MDIDDAIWNDMPITLIANEPGREVPLIIERPRSYSFAPGEENLYRPATEDEYHDYVAYWNNKQDEDESMDFREVDV